MLRSSFKKNFLFVLAVDRDVGSSKSFSSIMFGLDTTIHHVLMEMGKLRHMGWEDSSNLTNIISHRNKDLLTINAHPSSSEKEIVQRCDFRYPALRAWSSELKHLSGSVTS